MSKVLFYECVRTSGSKVYTKIKLVRTSEGILL